MKKCEIFKNFYGRFPVWQHVTTITHISNPDATLSMKTTIHPCSNLQTDLEHPLYILGGALGQFVSCCRDE